MNKHEIHEQTFTKRNIHETIVEIGMKMFERDDFLCFQMKEDKKFLKC
jgi:hypothetical protein